MIYYYIYIIYGTDGERPDNLIHLQPTHTILIPTRYFARRPGICHGITTIELALVLIVDSGVTASSTVLAPAFAEFQASIGFIYTPLRRAENLKSMRIVTTGHFGQQKKVL